MLIIEIRFAFVKMGIFKMELMSVKHVWMINAMCALPVLLALNVKQIEKAITVSVLLLP
jgi:hypothetical protein